MLIDCRDPLLPDLWHTSDATEIYRRRGWRAVTMNDKSVRRMLHTSYTAMPALPCIRRSHYAAVSILAGIESVAAWPVALSAMCVCVGACVGATSVGSNISVRLYLFKESKLLSKTLTPQIFCMRLVSRFR